MRADRLLAMLMLLQTRGHLTAEELARALEVSERTIYRDVDALTMAGVPIYAEHGQGGGYALLDSYRTTLTGLTEAEVRALFMLSIPEPLAELGVSRELRSALLKVAAALPDARREDASYVRQRIHVDAVGWFQGHEAVPHLLTIQRAVWEDRKLYLRVNIPFAGVNIEAVVDPYGLVAKAGAWYLVYGVGNVVRARRVAHLIEVRLQTECFARPQDFDLESFWRHWCVEFESNRFLYRVVVRVSPSLISLLPLYFGESVQHALACAGAPDAEGWIMLELPFESLEDARSRLLGLGRAVEVLSPPALRNSLLDYAEQIVALYRN
jgi:predicted DNA-binding transcriptional regulator YafY